MLKKLLPTLALAALLAPGLASAQSGRFELTPVAGYRLSNSFDWSETGNSGSLDVGSSWTAGLLFGWQISPMFDGEFHYDYAKTEVTGEYRTPLASRSGSFDLGMHNFQFVGLFHFQPPREKVRPFLGIGLGFAYLDPSNAALDSECKFSFSLHGGVKIAMSDRVGLRFDARWIPTYVFSTEGGYWCDPWYGCWYYGNDHYLNQIDFRGGVIIKF